MNVKVKIPKNPAFEAVFSEPQEMTARIYNVGDTGNGIADAYLNADYTLTLEFTDGTSYTTPPIRGEQGAQGVQGDAGEDGVSIIAVVLNDDYTLTIRFSDGTTTTTGSVRGPQGEQGAQGIQGNPGTDGEAGFSPVVTVTDISGGHRVTITDESGDHVFDVMDGEGAVISVNGHSGNVILDAADVGALPDDTAIPSALSDLTEDSTHRTVTDTEKNTWNAKSDFSGSYNDLSEKPFIPAALSSLTEDATHRTVTDSEKATWSAKSDFSGSYNDLTNKPTIPDELADLASDASHRTVTDTEKSTWSGKQDTISDLATIRSGAALGVTALQSVPNTYRTAAAQDTIDSGKLDKSGGTITGNLTVDGSLDVGGVQYVRGCNKNLLDNAHFQINQRGQNTYTGTQYTVDRWYKDYADPVVSVNASGVTLQFVSGSEQNFSQRIEFDVIEQCFGKSVTLSVLLNSGEVKSATFNMPNSYPDASTEVGKAILEDGLIAELRMYQKSFRNPIVRVMNRDQQAHEVTVKAIKLEIGSVSTLANEQPPDYAVELLKCQKYFFRLNPQNNSYLTIGCGVLESANTILFKLFLPTSMRTVATVVMDYGHEIINARYGGTLIYVSPTNAVITKMQSNYAVIRLTVSENLSINNVAFLQYDGYVYHIDLDADL